MSKVNFAIIGLGYWGPNLLRNIFALDNANVVAVCDLQDANLIKTKKYYPSIKFTKDSNELFNNSEIDAIVIATPVFTHFELAKSALEHGKHVLMEKPMASSVQECGELIRVAGEKGVILMVDHTFLYTGAVRKIKELINNGELGDLYYFDSERINLGLIQSDINVIWDLAPHDISIMNYIFEGFNPISVFAAGNRYVNQTVLEMAHVTVNFDSGIVGHIHASWLSPVKIRKILIGGDNKMIIYNDLEPSEKIKVYDKGISVNFSAESSAKPVYRSGDVFIPKLDTEEALKREIQHFINCVNGKEEPLVDGKAGLEVVKILEACDRSIKEGKKVCL